MLFYCEEPSPLHFNDGNIENELAYGELAVPDCRISKSPRLRNKQTSNAWKKLNSPSRNGTWSDLAQANARRTGDSFPTSASTTMPRASTCARVPARVIC